MLLTLTMTYILINLHWKYEPKKCIGVERMKKNITNFNKNITNMRQSFANSTDMLCWIPRAYDHEQ